MGPRGQKMISKGIHAHQQAGLLRPLGCVASIEPRTGLRSAKKLQYQPYKAHFLCLTIIKTSITDPCIQGKHVHGSPCIEYWLYTVFLFQRYQKQKLMCSVFKIFGSCQTRTSSESWIVFGPNYPLSFSLSLSSPLPIFGI